jgi:hypothetical protein
VSLSAKAAEKSLACLIQAEIEPYERLKLSPLGSVLGRPKGSERGPSVVQPFALDVPDLLLAHAETNRYVLPGLLHAHVVVLGVYQGQEQYLALVLG